MIRQTVASPKPGPLKGLLMVFGIVAALYVLSALAAATKIPYAWAAVWLLCSAAAVLLARRFLLGYRYILDRGALLIERMFGSQARTVISIPVADIVEIGDSGDLLKDGLRFEHRAVSPRCTVPPKALLYRAGNSLRLLEFQPDAALLAGLMKSLEGEGADAGQHDDGA